MMELAKKSKNATAVTTDTTTKSPIPVRYLFGSASSASAFLLYSSKAIAFCSKGLQLLEMQAQRRID